MKPIQIWFQTWYRIKSKIWWYKPVDNAPIGVPVKVDFSLNQLTEYVGDNTFTFLNISHRFVDIDWNYKKYGNLWSYNLNYFNYLNQDGMSQGEGYELIRDFISKKDGLKVGLDPYPTSLRIINWVKFLGKYPEDELMEGAKHDGQKNIKRSEIDIHLDNDCLRLSKNLEYHILGNHLLENGFGLLFGSYYFQNETLYNKAKKIIVHELKEQIMKDGGHYELSPMYHQIILFRVLDSYALVTSQPWQNQELKPILEDTAQKMLSWLLKMTFKNEEIPRVNDATDDVAPKTQQLVDYAKVLGVEAHDIPLADSGYRMFRQGRFELLCDVGQISPSYQPGHSHADNLNFILYYDGKPVVVDTGISTYEKNQRRQIERSTESHNTLVVDGMNSSDIWGGFRVGKRAKTSIFTEDERSVTASHDGYKRWALKVVRKFEIDDSSVKITDEVVGKIKNHSISGTLHFHPDIDVKLEGNNIRINDDLKIKIEGATEVIVDKYLYAQGYNRVEEAPKVRYSLGSEKVVISFKEVS